MKLLDILRRAKKKIVEEPATSKSKLAEIMQKQAKIAKIFLILRQNQEAFQYKIKTGYAYRLAEKILEEIEK